jgi:hypothetical protein
VHKNKRRGVALLIARSYINLSECNAQLDELINGSRAVTVCENDLKFRIKELVVSSTPTLVQYSPCDMSNIIYTPNHAIRFGSLDAASVAGRLTQSVQSSRIRSGDRRRNSELVHYRLAIGRFRVVAYLLQRCSRGPHKTMPRG